MKARFTIKRVLSMRINGHLVSLCPGFFPSGTPRLAVLVDGSHWGYSITDKGAMAIAIAVIEGLAGKPPVAV